MKNELPIIMSAPMVQSIKRDEKVVTRRMVTPQTAEDFARMVNLNAGINVDAVKSEMIRCSCPYGEIGTMLYVRERFCQTGPDFTNMDTGKSFAYFADDEKNAVKIAKDFGWKWKPSIHMPKDAARIWLQVEKISIERLHDITEAEAIKEGVESFIADLENFGARAAGMKLYKDYQSKHGHCAMECPIDSFKSLWLTINGDESWEDNPWLWVIHFKVISITGKP